MATRRTITVSITPAQDLLIQACLKTGRYSSTSEVMRAALRLLERDEAPALQTIGTTPAGREPARA